MTFWVLAVLSLDHIQYTVHSDFFTEMIKIATTMLSYFLMFSSINTTISFFYFPSIAVTTSDFDAAS